ncbi:MAG: hypothetical protein CFE26_24420 [Verrucomicrobiales bacterium VVV1]|nr:MAG: hypothetical protein CFE26_24420 [Verrucomicrobiales bacterium VVV1]
MLSPAVQKPYFEAWLKRTRRQLAPSGRLSEIAWLLALEDGSGHDDWRVKLRDLLEGSELPSLDLLMRIDSLLAGSKLRNDPVESQLGLF